MCVTSDAGNRGILAAYREMGVTLEGLKSAFGRLGKNGVLDRAKGSGGGLGGKGIRPTQIGSISRRRKASFGDAAADIGIPKTTTRLILKQDIDTTPFRKVANQRGDPANAGYRLNICRIRGKQLETGEIDVEKISDNSDKISRLGECFFWWVGRNFCAYVKNGAKKPTPQTT